MGTGNGSMVGMDPDLADVLVRELRAAEVELKACAAEGRRGAGRRGIGQLHPR